MEFIIIAMHKR